MVVEREYKKDDFDSRNSRIGWKVWRCDKQKEEDWIEIANEAAQIQREMGREK